MITFAIIHRQIVLLSLQVNCEQIVLIPVSQGQAEGQSIQNSRSECGKASWKIGLFGSVLIYTQPKESYIDNTVHTVNL